LLLHIVAFSSTISTTSRVSAMSSQEDEFTPHVSASGDVSRRAAGKADPIFMENGDETKSDGSSRSTSNSDLLRITERGGDTGSGNSSLAASTTDLVSNVRRRVTANTTSSGDTYPSRQGSYFLLHGGHHPSALNPSKLDFAFTKKNVTTEAIGASQDGIYDFGSGYQLNNTSTTSLEQAAARSHKQFSSSVKGKVEKAALNSSGIGAADVHGAIGSNSSRKAIGSNPSGLFYDLATMNLSDPLAILFKEGETNTPIVNGTIKVKAGNNTGNITTAYSEYSGIKPPSNVSAPTSSPREVNIIRIGTSTKPATNRSTPATSPKSTAILDAGTQPPTNISAPATSSKLDNVIDTGLKSTNGSVLDTSMEMVPVNIGTGQDLFDYTFYNPFEVKIVGGDLVSKEKSTAKYPYYTSWFEANCGGSLIHDDSEYFRVSTADSRMAFS
jgi:hypothetical protein